MALSGGTWWRRGLLVAFAVVALGAFAGAPAWAAGPVSFVRQFGGVGSGSGDLNTAAGLAVDPTTGNVVVADDDNERIDVFDSSGNFVKAWGAGVADGSSSTYQVCGPDTTPSPISCHSGVASGSAGGLNRPKGVAVDSSGNLFVADSSNNRVDEFDSSGAFVKAWGYGVIPGQTAGFQTCTQATGCQAGSQNGGEGAGTVVSPFGVAVGPSGEVFVGEFGTSRVSVFDPSSATVKFLRAWGWGVADQQQQFEICTSGCHAGSSGTGAGGQAGSFDGLTGITVDPSSGDVYTLDADNYRVQQFHASGAFVATWGWGVADGLSKLETCTSTATASPPGCQPGIFGHGGAGQFANPIAQPVGIAVDATGNIDAVDEDNNRVQQFAPNGSFQNLFGYAVLDGQNQFENCNNPSPTTNPCQQGTEGTGAGQLFLPTGIAADSTGDVYVDNGNVIEQYSVPVAPATLAAPNDVIASTASATEIDLSWQPVANATGYKVMRGTFPGGPYTTVGTPTGTSFNDTGVSPGTTYYYVLQATNATTTSPDSSEASATTAPNAPTGLTATTNGTSEIDLNWNPVTGATGYHLLRGTASGGPYTQIATPISTSYHDTGLTPNSTYYYVIQATNSGGVPSSNSTQASATTNSPATVTTGGVHDLTATATTLLGVVNANGTDTSYWFQYGTDQNYGQQSSPQGAGAGNNFAAAADITGLQPSTLYHYRIVAQQGGDTPIFGTDQTFTTPAQPAPANTTPPLISGTAQVGQTLTALTGDWSESPTSYSFQWRSCDANGANCQNITPNGTGQHFDVSSSQLGDTIRVRVAATNAGGTSSPADSDATAVVAAASGGGGTDAVAPSSTASSPRYAGTSFTVSYVASDPSPSSGLARVELWVKGPNDQYFQQAMTDSSPPANGHGSFSYTAAQGDGPYAFYARATDIAGNQEAQKASPDTITTVDTTRPSSHASVGPYSNTRALTVNYMNSDPAPGSGVADLQLWVKTPGAGQFTEAGDQPSPTANGSFQYQAASEGEYSFYVLATDAAGNQESAKSSPDATVIVDTTPPSISITTPSDGAFYVFNQNVNASYSCSDGSGSGIASCNADSEGQAVASGSAVPTDTSRTFLVKATDKAGNTITKTVSYTVVHATIAPPAIVTATPNGSTEVDLSWSAVSAAAGYKVLRSTTHGGPYTQVGTPSGTSYADTGLTPSTTYYYVVQSAGNLGAQTSLPSSEASATTASSQTSACSTGAAAGGSPPSAPYVLSVNGAEILSASVLSGLNPTQNTVSQQLSTTGNSIKKAGTQKSAPSPFTLEAVATACPEQAILSWAQDAGAGQPGSKKNATLTVYDTNGTPVLAYGFTNLWPSKVTFCGGLTAGTNACLDKYTFSYESITQQQPGAPVSTSSATTVSSGGAAISLDCTSNKPCTGTATVAYVPGLAHDARVSALRNLGTTNYKIKPHHKAKVSIRLNAYGRKLLSHSRGHRLAVALIVHRAHTPSWAATVQRILLVAKGR